MQWFNMQDDVDIVFYGKLANMCFNVFKQATRWNAIFKLAEEFNRISDDAFAETIIPFQVRSTRRASISSRLLVSFSRPSG